MPEYIFKLLVVLVKATLPKEHLRVLCELLKVVVLIDGVVHPQVEQLLQSLIDEDDADQRGERFLGEARDVTDERAGVRGHQQQTEEGRPQADTRPQGEVGEVVLPGRDRTHAYISRHGIPAQAETHNLY